MCNKAHKCSHIPMKTIIIQRHEDTTLTPDETRQIHGIMFTKTNVGLLSVNIVTLLSQAANQFITIGRLLEQDFDVEYKSDASSTYNSYIVNPSETFQYTTRELRGRILEYLEGGFYLSGSSEVAIVGPVEVIITFEKGVFNKSSESIEPTLLTWCTQEHIWVNASQSCGNNYMTSVDWENNSFKTFICNIDDLCKTTSVEPGSSDNGFKGPRSFVLAGTGTKFVNSPPIIVTNTSFCISEDAGTIQFLIEAFDPDFDEFEFVLNTEMSYKGRITLDTSGLGSYTPCKDCYGREEIGFSIHEVREDTNILLETKGLIKVDITEVNDNPVLMAVQNGVASFGSTTLSMDEYKVDSVSNFQDIVLVAYDVDADDMKVVIEGPQQGQLKIFNQAEIHSIIYQECEKPLGKIQNNWNALKNELQEHDTLVLPVPCGVEDDFKDKTFSWHAVLVEYIPNMGFVGQDNLKVYVVLLIMLFLTNEMHAMHTVHRYLLPDNKV